jgi:UDP-N-acetylmuramate dehydrogenase
VNAPARLATALADLGDLRQREPLARHTTFGVGGPADLFLTVRSSSDLVAATTVAAESGAPVFYLGSGSNILVADAGIRGLVIDNRARAETLAGTTVRIESGASFAALARRMCRRGLDGLAWAVGIPGTLGGAVVYNAGAYGGCLADVLRRVRLQLPGGGIEWVDASDLHLVYRGSLFTRGQLRGRAVLECELELTPGDPANLLARAASYDEKRLAAQPRGRSAGSTFKNPPEAPAWKLIDAVGMRGLRRGDAAVSDRHANFFVNEGNAAAADVRWLIDEARRRVFEKFGITLEPEVEFVGEWP